LALAHRARGGAASVRPRKIPELMGDMAKGIKNFRKGMSDEAEETKTVEHRADEPVGDVKQKATKS